MRKSFFAFALVLLTSAATAQESAVWGKVADTLEKKSLANAVVSLLYKSDSTLFKFTRTNNKGEFSINNVDTGKYVMLVSFPKFADYVDEVDVKQGLALDLGTIPLTQKAQLLKEVVVRSGSAIRIKGDTTEFAADSFAVKDGATVEDLLKKLPGFQVDSKGNITAQGQRVQKVLVDGEEFFGDDPTMATQNISAKAVDKVQLFESKTDQQHITGITMGNEGKTVNIQLKEDKKKGGFGRFYAGTDFQKYHDAKALYNRFIGKEKLSFYATKSTISTGSLNWEDRQKLGIENDFEYDEISGYYYSFGGGDDFNDWSLRGLPNSYSAGGLYANKWNRDKNNVNTSYRFNRLETRNDASTLSQTILPDGLLYTDRFVKSEGLNQQHALNGKYEWKIDSLASIKFSTAGIHKITETFNNTDSRSLNEKEELLNQSNQYRDNETMRKQLDNQLTYRQAFNKKNRLLLVNLRHGWIEDDQNGMLNVRTEFYKNGLSDSVGVTDQLKTFDGISKTLGSKITFSEPLSLKWNLVLDYAYNNNNSTSNRNTYNKSSNEDYKSLDSLFSNNFDLVAASHSSLALMRFVDKKLRFAFGSGLSTVQLKLNNLDNHTKNTYNFLNVTPQAQLGYAFKPQTNISVSYRGTTRQPRIDQLQPVRDNNDPLNIFIGNPDLKVGFNHGINAFFGSHKVLSQTSIWLNLGYNVTQNAITNFSAIDRETGRRTYSPINTDGVRNWQFYSEWNKGEGNKRWRKSIQVRGNGGRNINFINTLTTDFKTAEKAINDYTIFELNAGIGYEETDKYSFSVRPKIGHNSSGSSLQTAIDNDYFTYGGRVEGFVLLPGKIEVSTELNVDMRQRIAAFDRNTNIVQWNANIMRKIFKDKSGRIIFVANDILNQNRGFNRIINSNFISDERFLRVSQYFLLKFEWSFSKMPGSK